MWPEASICDFPRDSLLMVLGDTPRGVSGKDRRVRRARPTLGRGGAQRAALRMEKLDVRSGEALALHGPHTQLFRQQVRENGSDPTLWAVHNDRWPRRRA